MRTTDYVGKCCANCFYSVGEDKYDQKIANETHEFKL